MVIKKLYLGNNDNVVLTCYLHETNVEMSNIITRPAVMVLPGGGYYGCSFREAEPIALAYAAQGYHSFTLEYSVGQENPFPKPLEDAQIAMNTIQDNAENWLVDKERIAVAGFSAGGHLALALGTSDGIRPAALILGYPVVLAGTCDALAYEIPSLADKVDKTTPPTFVFSTCEDELVPITNSLALASSMDKSGIPFELHIFQKGHHGLSLAKSFTSNGYKTMVQPDVAQWFKLSLNWLRGTWGDFPSDRDELIPTLAEYAEYSIDVSLEDLWENSQCKSLIVSQIPQMANEEYVASMFEYNLSLRNFANYAEEPAAAAILQKLDRKLKELPLLSNGKKRRCNRYV